MPNTLKKVLDDALSLPEESRAYVAEILLESLDIGNDFPVSDTWKEEIERRCREIEEGEVELVAGDEAIARLRDRFS